MSKLILWKSETESVKVGYDALVKRYFVRDYTQGFELLISEEAYIDIIQLMKYEGTAGVIAYMYDKYGIKGKPSTYVYTYEIDEVMNPKIQILTYTESFEGDADYYEENNLLQYASIYKKYRLNETTGELIRV